MPIETQTFGPYKVSDFFGDLHVIKPEPGETFTQAWQRYHREKDELARDEKIAKLESEIESLKGTIDALNAKLCPNPQ